MSHTGRGKLAAIGMTPVFVYGQKDENETNR
jgi:hypothetical protein